MKTPTNKGYWQDEEGQWWYASPRRPRTRCKIKLCSHCREKYVISTYHAKTSRFCSKTCAGLAQPKRPGSKASRWNGGRHRTHEGYVEVYAPDHPRALAGGRKYAREHRLVMEKHLGRYLRADEVVHHINGVKDDNRLENLELRTRSAHALEHRPCFEPPHCPSCTCGK